MSKKNSIVLNHKNPFSQTERVKKLYLNFKKKISKFKTNKFLVAVSGGPDSLALAAMCKVFESCNPNKKFYYVNINHGIRKSSKTESKYVKKILQKQKIVIKIINNKKKIKSNIQHSARKIRYSLLKDEGKKRNINLILTAHHKDDQIENFLIRLSRGSGVQGLSSMGVISSLDNRTKVIRPFLTESKKELIFASKKIFGDYVKDPSNKNQKFLRSKIRKLLPILKKYGIEDDQIIKSINNLKSSNKTINAYFNEVLKKIVKKKKNFFIIQKKALFSLNDDLQIKILGFIIKSLSKSDYPPRSKKIINAIKFLYSKSEMKYHLGGCLLISKNSHIYIKKA